MEQRPLDNEEKVRMNDFIDDRKAQRDKLLDALNVAKIYFSKDLEKRIEQFVEWDEAFSTTEEDDLPSVDVWWQKERELRAAIKYEIGI